MIDDILLDWLRDAHAMEQQAESMLSAMAARIESYPDLHKKIEEHLAETQEQARLLEGCIKRRGGDTSVMKDMTGKAMAAMQGVGGMFASDEVIKGGIASFAFEQFEIASYQVLVEGARAAGDSETQQVCQKILEQEIAMAAWLQHNMAALTRRYLDLALTPGAQAKR